MNHSELNTISRKYKQKFIDLNKEFKKESGLSINSVSFLYPCVETNGDSAEYATASMNISIR